MRYRARWRSRLPIAIEDDKNGAFRRHHRMMPSDDAYG
jgi:hypothetical protein